MSERSRTWEVRWFLPDDEVAGRLFGTRSPTASTARRDWYAPSSNPATGIKLREGTLQPKLLEHDAGIRDLGPARGRVQQWSKWTLDVPAGDDPPDEALLATSGWIAVDKRRHLRFFRVDDNGVAEVGSMEAAQCQMEWTEIQLGSRHHWSLGFEAFSTHANADLLRRIVVDTLGARPLETQLTASRSLGYPAWLIGEQAALQPTTS